MKDLIDMTAREFHLTDEERRALLPSGRQTTIANRTHWAVAYLNRAGLITRVARGLYEVSDLGRNVLADPPANITIKYLQRFPAFEGFREAKRNDAPASGLSKQVSQEINAASGGTPEEKLETASSDLKADLPATLLARLRNLTPTAFEQLIIDVLVKMGYGGSRQEAAAELLGGPGDGGVDGVIREDPLGLDLIYVQAKRYAEDNTIGPSVIQAFAGALLQKGRYQGCLRDY